MRKTKEAELPKGPNGEEIKLDFDAIGEALRKSRGPKTAIVERSGRRFEVTTTPPGSGLWEKGSTVERELPAEVDNFVCQCGSTKFEALYKPQEDWLGRRRCEPAIFGPPQGPTHSVTVIKHYRCAGCTTHFDDPVRYSQNRPKPE